jgi:hypothetical protein
VSFTGNNLPVDIHFFPFKDYTDKGDIDHDYMVYEDAHLIKVGYCVDIPKGYEQRHVSTVSIPKKITSDPDPGMLSQVFILMTG